MPLSAVDFELLLQANRILSSKLNVSEVLEAVLELATKVVKAEASSLLLLDEKKNELYFDVTLGSVKESVKQIRLKVGEGIAGWVAKEKVPLIVNDVTKDSRFTKKVDKSTSFITRSVLAVPLVAKGKLIGVVEAINKEMNQEFSDNDKEAFEIFASQSAIAIENARLFSDVSTEKQKLNTVFAEMSDGVILLDESGKVVILNEAGGRFLGLALNQVLGKTFGPDLFPRFESPPEFQEIKNMKKDIRYFDLVRREGKDFFLSLQAHKLHETRGGGAGYLVILHDTTEEKREGRLKQNFLSLISHKLKTPLTVIIGYAPALNASSENLSSLQKKAVTAIADQGEHLRELVDKLLLYTLVESESLKKESESKELSTLIQEAADGLDLKKNNKKININYDSSIKSMPKATVDRKLMVEVFKNLLENAIKFNDKNEKEITVASKSADNFVRVSIKDNGVGIPSEERVKIFQKFYQIENSFTGQVPGAGLGLALCRKVVEEMGGQIDVESEIGKGSTFIVSLPCD